MIQIFEQAAMSLGFFAALVFLMRMGGKRLAGQTTTFDLVVLITLAVVMQTIALREGVLNGTVFLVTVFAAHWALAALCAKSRHVRRLVRGAPRPLVRNGVVAEDALEDEGLTYDDLLAGLRKLGYEGPDGIRLATLEETGHISAIARDQPDGGSSSPSGTS